MEIEGKIEAISYKNKGIKINGKWYNVPEDVIKTLSKNQIVKLTIDDYSNVLSVDIIGKYEEIDSELKIEALRSAIDIVRLSLQYGSPEFVPGSELQTYDKVLKKLVKDVLDVYNILINKIK